MESVQNYLIGQRDKLLAGVMSRKYPNILMDKLLTRNTESTWADSVVREADDIASTLEGDHRGSDGGSDQLITSAESTKVFSSSRAVRFTLQEIQQGLEFGRDLKSRATMAQYNKAAWEVNKIALVGAQGKTGLYNNASVAKSSVDWASLLAAANTNPQAVIDALATAVEAAKTGCGMTAEVDSIIFPSLTKIRLTILGDNSGKTLYTLLQESLPNVQLLEDSLLATAGAGGVSRVVVSTAGSEHIAENAVTQPPQFTDIAQVGAAHYEMACLYSTAGCLLHQPEGIRYLDGDFS